MPQTRVVTSQEGPKKQIGMSTNKVKALSEGRCFKCFEKGHLAWDCPNQDLRIQWTEEEEDSSKEENLTMVEFMWQMQMFMTATTSAISELQQKQQKEKDF